MVQFYNPVVICSVCREHGHSKSSCRYSRADNLVSLSQEDIAFWAFIHPRDRPECLGGVSGEPMDADDSTNEENDGESEGGVSGDSDSEEYGDSDVSSD